LVAALHLLFGLPSLLIIPATGLLGMMYRTIQIRTYLLNGAHITTLGDDGLGDVLALLELGALGVVLRLRASFACASRICRVILDNTREVW
jgi:hypothetical protein